MLSALMRSGGKITRDLIMHDFDSSGYDEKSVLKLMGSLEKKIAGLGFSRITSSFMLEPIDSQRTYPIESYQLDQSQSLASLSHTLPIHIPGLIVYSFCGKAFLENTDNHERVQIWQKAALYLAELIQTGSASRDHLKDKLHTPISKGVTYHTVEAHICRARQHLREVDSVYHIPEPKKGLNAYHLSRKPMLQAQTPPLHQTL